MTFFRAEWQIKKIKKKFHFPLAIRLSLCYTIGVADEQDKLWCGCHIWHYATFARLLVMKRNVLVAIAKKMAAYDKHDTPFYQGAFTALHVLLQDFGYDFGRTSDCFFILLGYDVVCSVPRC